MYELFFYAIAVLTVTLQFFGQWYFAKGNLKLAYPLTMAVVLCYIVTDIVMVLYDSVLMGILIFSIANIWSLIMCIKGMWRLRKENNENA